jgi:hypothetical protein
VDDAGDGTLRYCDIAIGYLSRNPRYRAEYRRALAKVKRGVIGADAATAGLLRRWGISFHAAPASAWNPELAVVRPDLSPASVILMSPPDIVAASPFAIGALGTVRAAIRFDGAAHLIVADPQGDLSLWLLAPANNPVAIMLPVGDGLGPRFTEAERLRRHLRGLPAGPPALLVPPARRRYLRTLLRVVAGRQAGVRARELAAVLIDPKVREYSAAAWDDSAERRQIGRGTIAAFELVNGGYIRLLRGG